MFRLFPRLKVSDLQQFRTPEWVIKSKATIVAFYKAYGHRILVASAAFPTAIAYIFFTSPSILVKEEEPLLEQLSLNDKRLAEITELGEKLRFTESDWGRLRIVSSSWLPTSVIGRKYGLTPAVLSLHPEGTVKYLGRDDEENATTAYLTEQGEEARHLPQKKLVLKSLHQPYKTQRDMMLAEKMAAFKLFPASGHETFLASICIFAYQFRTDSFLRALPFWGALFVYNSIKKSHQTQTLDNYLSEYIGHDYPLTKLSELRTELEDGYSVETWRIIRAITYYRTEKRIGELEDQLRKLKYDSKLN